MRVSMLAWVALKSMAVLSSFGPGAGLGLRSKAGDSAQDSARSCRNPWLRRWSSVLDIRTEKHTRRQSSRRSVVTVVDRSSITSAISR